jgi:membrane fusion protein, multidrug efflux system
LKSRYQSIAVGLGSIAVLVAVCGIGGYLAWFKYSQIVAASEQGPPPEMPEAVTIAPAKSIAFRASVTAIGTIRAPRSITLSNEVAGTVTSIKVESGEIVTAGHVLVLLDHAVEDAMLASAKAQQQMARSMLERTQRVARENASSANEIDQAVADMAQSDAEVARLSAIIEKKTLKAPFQAKAGLVNTHVGQYLSEGTEITSLQGIDDYVDVDFMMPQSVADSVEIGQEIGVLLQPQSLSAELVALDAIADRSTRNLMGRARLKQPPAFLQPNDAVKVRVEYGPEQTAIAVPAEALRRSPTGAFVYVAENDQTGSLRAQIRRVVPGQSIDGAVVVSGGVNEGDSVIVDGSFKLREGSLVMDHTVGEPLHAASSR